MPRVKDERIKQKLRLRSQIMDIDERMAVLKQRKVALRAQLRSLSTRRKRVA